MIDFERWLGKNPWALFLLFSILLLVPQLSLSEIYQWTDENGVIHFSDKNLNNKTSSDVSTKYDVKDPFTIDIESRGYRIPLKTKGVIRSSVLKMGEILSNKLGVEYKDGAHIKIVIFANKKDYHDYGGKKRTSGFYSLKRKEAVIMKSRNVDKTIETIVHETSHLLLRFNYGYVPRWLNEGLAEYFETMKLSFSSVEIQPNYRWNKKLKTNLRSGNIMKIADFVSLTTKQWISANKTDDNMGYVYSWALVFFLMSSEEGQITLKELFSGLKGNQRDKDYTAKSLNHSYPGGVENMEKDWHRWIYTKKTSVYY